MHKHQKAIRRPSKQKTERRRICGNVSTKNS